MAGVLDGRVALVTGAASGMGRVMARALAGAGAKVAGLDLNRAGLDALGSEAVFSGKLLPLTGDVSNAADCQRVVQETATKLGGLDILINCAGVNMGPATPPGQGRAKFYEADAAGTLKIFAINMGGVYLMSRYAAIEMLKKNWGRIVNITTSFDTMLTDRHRVLSARHAEAAGADRSAGDGDPGGVAVFARFGWHVGQSFCRAGLGCGAAAT